jgi:hypothetical protein
MALHTLRAADEVRAPQFGHAEGDLDAEMVAAATIIRQRTRNFDPSTSRDRYQEALQQLIEAKMKGLIIKPKVVPMPSPVIDLMAALKRSLAGDPGAPEQQTAKRKRTKRAPDRSQPALLLPLTGDRKQNNGAWQSRRSPALRSEVEGRDRFASISMTCRRPSHAATPNSKLLALGPVTASTMSIAASEPPPWPRSRSPGHDARTDRTVAGFGALGAPPPCSDSSVAPTPTAT